MVRDLLGGSVLGKQRQASGAGHRSEALPRPVRRGCSAPDASAHAAGWRNSRGLARPIFTMPRRTRLCRRRARRLHRSVHCPHTIIEEAIGKCDETWARRCPLMRRSARNAAGLHGPWQRRAGRPLEMTDTRSLAKQLVWPARWSSRRTKGQHRQWRHIPLELDVSPHCEVVWRRMGHGRGMKWPR